MIAAAMAWIAARTGLGAGALKLIGGGLLIAGAFIAWQLFLADVRRDALRDASAASAEADRQAAAKSSEQRRADDARISAERSALERMKPDAPFQPIGPDEQRRFDCIRLQQHARAAHRFAPRCD